MGIRTACRRLAARTSVRSLLVVPFLFAIAACSENATEPLQQLDATPSLSLTEAQLSGVAGPIVSKLASGICMDYDSNGAVINNCDGTKEQNFTFKSNGSIVASNSSCVGVDGDTYAARIHVRKCDGSTKQKWTATNAGELRGIGGKCIGVAGNNSRSGTKLVLWDCNGTSSQKWDASSTGAKIAANAVAALSITGLTVASGKSYKILSAGTKTGAVAYIDRTYHFSTIPSVVNGATYIRTANDDKFASLGSSSFLSFTVNQDVDVYVAHGNDTDLLKPSWLTSSFTKTTSKLVTDKDGLSFTLYKKRFAKGKVTLGSNTSRATDGSMYIVFVVGNGSGPITTPTPTQPPKSEPDPTPTPGGGSSSGSHSGIFVSPSGSSSASGTESSPMSLSAALSGGNGKIQAGDTVWLRKGTYSGKFSSSLSGTASAPIVVRQYPGERATVNGNMAVNGRYTWYWGFEVANTNTGTQDVMGIDSHCTGCRFINLVIHDHSGNGLGMWSEGPDQEAYGNVIYNNGFHGSTSSSFGHGIYAQNVSGTKRIIDNILVNQFGYGVHVYTEGSGLRNFTISGNAVINSGQGTGMDYQVGGMQPVVNLTFTNNMSYHDPKVLANTARLGYNWGPSNSGAVVTGNYLVGKLLQFSWSGMTFSGNTIIDGATPAATKVFVEPNSYEAGRANVIIYNWGNQGAVSVDLSKALRKGQAYEVRNAQDFYGAAVSSGTYGGGSVSLPITSVAPARSITGKSLSSTGSRFAAYVVVAK